MVPRPSAWAERSGPSGQRDGVPIEPNAQVTVGANPARLLRRQRRNKHRRIPDDAKSRSPKCPFDGLRAGKRGTLRAAPRRPVRTSLGQDQVGSSTQQRHPQAQRLKGPMPGTKRPRQKPEHDVGMGTGLNGPGARARGSGVASASGRCVCMAVPAMRRRGTRLQTHRRDGDATNRNPKRPFDGLRAGKRGMLSQPLTPHLDLGRTGQPRAKPRPHLCHLFATGERPQRHEVGRSKGYPDREVRCRL